MKDIEKRARELLAAEYRRGGANPAACDLLAGRASWPNQMALNAIIVALTPPEGYVSHDELLAAQDRAFYDGVSKAEPQIPEGYVLVPAEPTVAMVDALYQHTAYDVDDEYMRLRQAYSAMLAARPEVK